MHVDKIPEQVQLGLSSEETAAWLGFNEVDCKGLGIKRIEALYEYFGNLSKAWLAKYDELKHVPGLPVDIAARFVEKRKGVSPEKLLDKCNKLGVKVLPLAHPEYPHRLKEIYDPPPVLFVKGSLTQNDFYWSFAIVGTRKPTAYGQKHTKEISKSLAGLGITIVSGMAIGIDSFAHRSAIEANGRTIAILGNGVDICYPSSNRPLYEALISGKHGAVISEFFPGTKPEKWRFPARNRIISGISQGLCVIEAGATSGSLISAHLAFEQNRNVFALPGSVDSKTSEGTNKIIASTKAHSIRNYEDIMEAMSWASNKSKEVPTLIQLYGREKEVYDLLSNEPVHFDVLVERTGIPAGELSATLTMLELGGVITTLAGDWYIRA